MTRTGCVWCPDWPVVAARRHDEALRTVPVVVRARAGSRDVVRAASAEARAAGVTRGMRRREAEACCPDAVCVDADEAGEVRAFEIVARAVERFTPRLVLDRPGRCAFPTRGPSRYFGGDEPLAQQVREAVSDTLGPDGDDVRIGIADGLFTAQCATRHASRDRPMVVPAGGSAAFLAPWPVHALGDDAFADLCVRLGLDTLGAVAALPRASMSARFGADGERLHDLARGFDPQPPALTVAPADLAEQTGLDPPAERVDAAAFAAKECADRVCARLAAHGLVCTQVRIEVETEHGERLERGWRHEHGLTPGALVERVRWQLDGWVATGATTAGITLLRIVPDEIVPADGRQLGFWGGDQVARDRADRAFTRLQGLFGPDAVVTAVLQGGRTPSERVRWVPWGEPREPRRPLAAGTEPCPWPGALPPPHPARVFDPPLPAELTDADGAPVRVTGRGEQRTPPAFLHSRVVRGVVRGWAGPWAHDVRWWDPGARDRVVRYQLVVAADVAGSGGGGGAGDGGGDGDAPGVACIVAIGNGVAVLEAIYD